MESSSPSVPFPLLQTPVEANYRACTIPYRFPSDNPRKATPIEIQWIDLFLNSVPSFRQRAENDPTVIDAPEKAEKFAQRLMIEILIYVYLLCRLREQALREFGFRDIFKKVKDEENAKAISLFEDVVRRNDAIDEGNRVENLIRGILAGNIFDLGSAQAKECSRCQCWVKRHWPTVATCLLRSSPPYDTDWESNLCTLNGNGRTFIGSFRRCSYTNGNENRNGINV
ncbi:hypothetical protein IEQ34_005816 [Dendrobium chrysotoxum]|uniref:Damage-control phosphatase ARMT1-like metal-binding domain-containing protein n=1 Tax=Dendrobium chrysotoxum TaxID=161865 RepID=A0AAV7HDR2_DENCH|nr:hypothetical protein IEQ34_005816 [Dendrobium chrysotoxum]